MTAYKTNPIRAIYHGMGAAEDPDVEDYYNKTRSFPLTYSPEDDPEVIEDMRVAAAELERGSDNDNEGGEGGNESSDDSSESNESDAEAAGQDGGDEGWEDDEDEDGTVTQSMGRKRSKMMLVIDKVQTYEPSHRLFCSLMFDAPSFTLSLSTFFDLKSSARKSIASFKNSVRQSIVVSFQSGA